MSIPKTLVLNQSPVLRLNKIAFFALLYSFSKACIMLALMLHHVIFAKMALCQTMSIYEDMIQILMML